jgi:ABC-type transporter Mla MlaB component
MFRMSKAMLQITTERYIDEAVITIIKLSGRLDGSSSSLLINTVRRLLGGGEHQLIFDLQDISLLGSAGLVALHQVARLLRGEPVAQDEFGWGAFHELEHDLLRGESLGIKVLHPSPAAIETMVSSGFAALVEPYASPRAAACSFRHN